jgi:hypothetical protein
MSGGAGAAATRQLSDDMRDAIRSASERVPPVLVHSAPDLGLHHAVGSVRAGGRALRGLNRLATMHPGFLAGVCWAGWAWTRSFANATSGSVVVDAVGTPITDHLGRTIPNPISAVASLTAEWFGIFALLLTVVSVVAGIIGVTSRPTHRLGSDGRLRAVKGHTSLARRRQGNYRRIKGRRSGVLADWKAAKRDVKAAEKRLARAGAWQRRRWARQHEAELARGVPVDGLTRPGALATLLMKRAPVKATASTAKAKKRRARRAEAVELEAEWDIEEARLEADKAMRATHVLPARPHPGIDPAAPPLPAGAPVHEFLAELVDAQTNGSEP